MPSITLHPRLPHNARFWLLALAFYSVPLYFSPIVSAAPPYPPSAMIEKLTWDSNTLQLAAPGSDQFSSTWGNDDHIYTAWGDGGGFDGTNSDGRVSVGVGRIEGTPTAWTGVNLWGGKNPLSTQTPTTGKPNSGLIEVDGTLYIYIAEQGVWTRSKLWSSQDYGLTWRDHGWFFDGIGMQRGSPGIIQFGKANYGALDSYIYGYLFFSSLTDLYLFRVDQTQITNPAAYQYFSGSTTSPTWSANPGASQPVFSDPNKIEWGPSAFYHPVFKRYWLSVRHSGETGLWGIFDAPNPWGPWTTVAYDADLPAWTGTPPAGTISDPGDPSRPAYIHTFPIKWISSDGLTMWQISDRGDQFNLAKLTVSLKNGLVSPTPTTPATATPTPTPIPPPLVGDFDLDGDVDFKDFISFLPRFNQTTNLGAFDLISNNLIDIFDFNVLLSNFLTAPSSLTLSNLTVQDTANAADWSLQTNIKVGDFQYGDRTFTFSAIPASLIGSPWVKTANDSKAATPNPLVTFTLNQAATVYVAHDDRITAKPGWLDASWTDAGSDLISGGGTYSLYTKAFPAGTVSLGPNQGDNMSMYTVIVD